MRHVLVCFVIACGESSASDAMDAARADADMADASREDAAAMDATRLDAPGSDARDDARDGSGLVLDAGPPRACAPCEADAVCDPWLGECVPRTLRVEPVESYSPLRNPHMGWLPYVFQPIQESVEAIDVAGGNTPLASAIYSNYFTLGDLAPARGAYRFDYIDRLIFRARQSGQKVRIAIVASSPGAVPNDGFSGAGVVPWWLVTEWMSAGQPIAECHERWAAVGSTSGAGCSIEPYYWHPGFLSFHSDFVAALGARFRDPSLAGYDGAPDWRRELEAIEISTYGWWGEWHSTSFEANGQAAQKPATLRRLVDDYLAAFAGAPAQFALEISGAAAANGYTNEWDDRAAIVHAVMDGRAGLVRKFIGLGSADPSAPNPFFTPVDAALVSTWVSHVPFRGEWGAFWGDLFEFRDPSNVLGGNLATAIDHAISLRVSMLGWHMNEIPTRCACPPSDCAPCGCTPDARATGCFRSVGRLDTMLYPGTTETYADYYQRRAGYRFVLREARVPAILERGAEMAIEMRWAETGSAKLYYPYYLRLYLVDAAGTLRALGTDRTGFEAHTWQLDAPETLETATFMVPDHIPPGRHELRFAIVDDFDEPAMNISIEGRDTTSPSEYGRYRLGMVAVP